MPSPPPLPSPPRPFHRHCRRPTPATTVSAPPLRLDELDGSDLALEEVSDPSPGILNQDIEAVAQELGYAGGRERLQPTPPRAPRLVRRSPGALDPSLEANAPRVHTVAGR